MFQLTIPSIEHYDSINDLFFRSPEYVLQLEHSLVSLSKWESKWCKPFLTNETKTHEETIDYIRCMTLTQNAAPEAYDVINAKCIDDVNAYIERPMTATVFSKSKEKPSRDVITAELIYYWMVALNVPFECQKWHLNRLLTLIEVCNRKNKPQKKMSNRELLAQNAAINESRRNELNTKG